MKEFAVEIEEDVTEDALAECIEKGLDVTVWEVKGKPDERLQGRIRYVENFMDEGEFYVFEIKWTNEDSWGMETAYRLIDDRLSYEALTHIRKWQDLGIEFWFAKGE